MQQTLALFLAATTTDVEKHHEKMILQTQLRTVVSVQYLESALAVKLESVKWEMGIQCKKRIQTRLSVPA